MTKTDNIKTTLRIAQLCLWGEREDPASVTLEVGEDDVRVEEDDR